MGTNNSDHTQTNTSKSIVRLNRILENKYRELFGEGHLYEDLDLMNSPQPPITTHRINQIKVSALPIHIQYKKGMAEYRRDKEAEVT